LLQTSNIINNATFAPFTVYGVVALIYFALCFPLTSLSRWLERRLVVGARS
jgi:polar amino acid transport system permease protein